MKRILLLLPLLLMLTTVCAQSGLYVPSAKPVKDMQKALTNPQTFCLLLAYQGDDSTYSVSDLDLLDSAYRIAFNVDKLRHCTIVMFDILLIEIDDGWVTVIVSIVCFCLRRM
jgi:hypothetical protein